MYGRRLRRAAGRVRRAGIDALLVTHPPNVHYLSGFTGSAGWLVVTAGAAALLTDSRYSEQAGTETAAGAVRGAPRMRVLLARGGYPAALGQWLRDRGCRRAAFEAPAVTVAVHRAIRSASHGVRWSPAPRWIERMRCLKDDAELRGIRRAVRAAEESFREVLPSIRPGAREWEVAARLEEGMRRRGAQGAAFPTIVASGERSALPHGVAGERRLRPGDLLVIDFGARMGGYHSDLTRTLSIGPAGERQRALHEAVRAAHGAGIRAARPGRRIAAVDRAARRRLVQAGLGDRFGHATGHGIGLEVHEDPRIGPGVKGTLRPGMVITVEPGAYVPGFGGVRIEDMLCITRDGARRLTRLPTRLQELPA